MGEITDQEGEIMDVKHSGFPFENQNEAIEEKKLELVETHTCPLPRTNTPMDDML